MAEESHQNSSHWPISILSSIAALFNMALPLFLVRLLSPEEVGTFKIFFLYLLVMPTITLSVGLTNGLAYWSGRGKQGHEAIRQISFVLLLLAVLATGLSWLLREPIVLALGWSADVFLVFTLALFAYISSLFFEEAAICRGRIWLGAIFYSGFELLRTICMILTAYIYRDLYAVFVVFTSVIWIKAIAGYLIGFNLGLVGFTLDSATLKALARYALPVALAGLLSIPVNYADQLILSTYITADQFALYTIGCLAIPPIIILEHSATRVLIPQMSAAFAIDQPQQAALLYRKTVEQLGFLIVPAVFGLVVFAQPIIKLLFTEQYSAAAVYLQLFAVNYLMLVFPNDVVPRARGEGGWILRNFTIFSAIALLLCLFMVKLYGALGALVAILLARAAMRFYGVLYIRSSTLLKFGDYLPLVSLRRFFTVAIVLSVIVYVLRSLFSSKLDWFLVCAPLFAFLYFATFFVWKGQLLRVDQKKPAVLIISQYLRIGGLERMILSLATELQERGWPVIIFCYDGVEFEGNLGVIPEFEKRGIKVVGIQKKRGFSCYVVWRLFLLILKNNIEVIHTHDLGALIYGSLVKLFIPIKVQLVHTQHSWVYIKRRPRDYWYQKKFSHFANQLVAVSSGNLQGFVELGFRADQISLIENGIEVPATFPDNSSKLSLREVFLKQQLSPEQRSLLTPYINDTWILYLARFDTVKGQGNALNLWARIDADVRKQAVLIFVGPGRTLPYYRQFTKMYQQSPQRDRLLLPGETNVPSEWLRVSDLYLSCSEFEGLPLGPLEALASGTPALVSDIAGHGFLREVTTQFSLNDLDVGARRLERLIDTITSNEDRLIVDLERGYRWVCENYSVSRMAEQYEQLYWRLVGRR